LMLVDPVLVKEFYGKTDKYIKSPLTITHFKLLMGNGLITSEGDTWKKHRRLISSLFHFEFLKMKIPLIVETTREFYDKMEKDGLDKVDIMNEFQKITGQVVGKIFFDRNLDKYHMDDQPLTVVLAELISEISLAGRKPLRMVLGGELFKKTPLMKRIIAKINKFRGICNEIVSDRRNSKKISEITNQMTQEKDLLDLLLDLQQTNAEDAIPDEEIIDEFVSFFLAGMDTTGHLMTMMTYNICTHPQYLDTVREEISKIYSGRDLKLTVEDLNSMNFLNLLIKETLRFNGPVNGIFFREALEDHNLGDVKVKKGTLLGLMLIYNNYNPMYYENVEKFDPYRWSEEKTKNLPPFAYIPFSAGSRNCIGQHLSQIEAKIMMSEFLQRYDCKISEGYEHKMTVRFMYEPYHTLKVDLKKRSSRFDL